MFVCSCRAVTDHEIRDVVVEHRECSLDDVMRCTTAGTVCGECRPSLARVIAEAVHPVDTPVGSAA